MTKLEQAAAKVRQLTKMFAVADADVEATNRVHRLALTHRSKVGDDLADADAEVNRLAREDPKSETLHTLSTGMPMGDMSTSAAQHDCTEKCNHRG